MQPQPLKIFIQPEELRVDSFKLAAEAWNDGFRPDFIVAIWRGGAPIGCYVHEFFKRLGLNPDHIAIRTSRYTGIDVVEESDKVNVHNLGYLLERLNSSSKVLFIDDVYDSGLSMEAVLRKVRNKLGENCPTDMRVATVYYKPKRNKTGKVPEYYVHETEGWLVFPHEMEGLSLEEIEKFMGKEVADLLRCECSSASTTK